MNMYRFVPVYYILYLIKNFTLFKIMSFICWNIIAFQHILSCPVCLLMGLLKNTLWIDQTTTCLTLFKNQLTLSLMLIFGQRVSLFLFSPPTESNGFVYYAIHTSEFRRTSSKEIIPRSIIIILWLNLQSSLQGCSHSHLGNWRTEI